jgi:hypothetical protein
LRGGFRSRRAGSAIDGSEEKVRPGYLPGRGVHGSGGGGGTRTPDLYSAIVALSQLSYAPRSEPGSVYGVEGCGVKGDRRGAVDRRHAGAYNRGVLAGVTQLVEYLLPKQAVAGSSPVPRSPRPSMSQKL